MRLKYYKTRTFQPGTCGLIALGNTLASIRHTKFYIHFPLLYRNSDCSSHRGILHCIVQQIKHGFRRLFAVVGKEETLRAVHCNGNFAEQVQHLILHRGKGLVI